MNTNPQTSLPEFWFIRFGLGPRNRHFNYHSKVILMHICRNGSWASGFGHGQQVISWAKLWAIWIRNQWVSGEIVKEIFLTTPMSTNSWVLMTAIFQVGGRLNDGVAKMQWSQKESTWHVQKQERIVSVWTFLNRSPLKLAQHNWNRPFMRSNGFEANATINTNSPLAEEQYVEKSRA